MNYEKLSLLQALKRWPRITMYSISLSLNILLWGYDSAIVGNVSSMPVFMRVFGVPNPDYGGGDSDNKYIIESIWLSIWSIGMPIGSMIGAGTGGWIQDRTGRKWTLLIGGVISVIAITVCYVADLAKGGKQGVLLVGKLLEGLAVGVIICSTQTYLSEVVPARLRGPILALFPIFTLLGQLVAAVVVLLRLGTEGKSGYRVALASEYPFSTVPIILAFVLPESPVWLIRKEKIEQARSCFKRLHGATVAATHQDLFDEMHKAVHEEQEKARGHSANYIDCFRGTNLRRTFIVVFAYTIEELWGLTLLGHVSYFLQLIGLDSNAAFIILILGVVFGLFANIGSFWTLLRFGRRLLILSTLSLVSVFWLSMGIAGCFKTKAVPYYIAAAMMAIVITAGLGAWPAGYVVASETSSLRLRSKTTGLGWLIGGIIRLIFGFTVPYLYNTDAANLGGKIGFVYIATTGLGVAITWFFVPEMKGLNSSEIDRLFERGAKPWQTGTGFRRVNTSQFERVESTEDETPLRNFKTMSSDRSDYDSYSGVINVQEPMPPQDAFEPLRKRPTF
ncbi:hypothetical protein LTR37_012973 [Vermiconidia calcicola]|uniref:Uncharacterized protein n=1 Tax=Vermiconidia calcicola TaxID=1690605 RepID=A0ACC3MY64_9PEZI|nr:hypothetical protein LTR37_012973 [Vermiconidia calcicola]